VCLWKKEGLTEQVAHLFGQTFPPSQGTRQLDSAGISGRGLVQAGSAYLASMFYE